MLLVFPPRPSFSRMLPYSRSLPTSTSTFHPHAITTFQRLLRVLEAKRRPPDPVADQLYPSSIHHIPTKRKRKHPYHRLLQRHRNRRLLRFPSLARENDQSHRRCQQRLLDLLRRRNLANDSYLVTPPLFYVSPPRPLADSTHYSLAATLHETLVTRLLFRDSACSFGDSRSGGSDVAYSSDGRRYTYR